MKEYMNINLRDLRARSIILFVIAILCPVTIWAQNTEVPHYERDTLISAAKEIMETSRYCALVTLDNSGHPQARTMDPFLPEEDMVVWMGTNKNSRKVRELRNDSRVTLYYEAPNGSGYLVIQGMAELIDDPEAKERYWKEEWDRFYPDKESSYTLIKVTPEKLEIIYYSRGITGASETWTVPYAEF